MLSRAAAMSSALERAHELLYYLREAVESGRLSKSMQVFLDSPMAISATEIFRHHPECFDAEAFARFGHRRDPFMRPGLHFTRQTADSMDLNRISGGAVILAGSGMATGGRIRHHLKHNLWRQNSSVIFVGFAARGTLARQTIDGAKTVHLFGEEIPVRARIHTINGFYVHADRDELLASHRSEWAQRECFWSMEKKSCGGWGGFSKTPRWKCSRWGSFSNGDDGRIAIILADFANSSKDFLLGCNLHL